MTDKCCDEGTIQAFLDGELESDKLEAVARHTASCEVCVFLLQEAEEESSFAFSALGEEFNSLVPTERIRTNLYKEIAQIEKPQKSIWTRLFGAGFGFSNPSLVSFASLLLVAGLFTTLYIYRENHQIENLTASSINKQGPTRAKQSKDIPVINPVVNTPSNENPAAEPSDELVEKASNRPAFSRRAVVNAPSVEKAAYKVINKTAAPTFVNDNRKNSLEEMMPGEESYVKTIATLSDSVNNRKDNALRPSERVAFEKDLAVVNDAITKMQREVKKNPKNEAAKQVLRSSYQNKIDMLNSVAERTELMATLR